MQKSVVASYAVWTNSILIFLTSLMNPSERDMILLIVYHVYRKTRYIQHPVTGYSIFYQLEYLSIDKLIYMLLDIADVFPFIDVNKLI